MSEDDKYNGLELTEQECKGHYVFKTLMYHVHRDLHYYLASRKML